MSLFFGVGAPVDGLGCTADLSSRMYGTRVLAILALSALGMSFGVWGAGSSPVSQRSVQDDGQLVDELGCAACHVGLGGDASTIRQRAPSLAHAGERFQPAYLYAYLMDPQAVRRHIGRSRMPNFGLSERESLALTRFLQTRTSPVERVVPGAVTAAGGVRVREADAVTAITDLGCTGCHTLDGSGGSLAADLGIVGQRLTEEFMRRHLAAPQAFDSGTTMPSLFYTWTAGTPREVVPEAAGQIRHIAAYLFSRRDDDRRTMERAFDSVRGANADVTAEMGAGIAEALNCAGCHRGLGQPGAGTAPGLNRTDRFRENWLRTYLAEPYPVRPFGHRPGTGSRMPDFGLDAGEVASIVAYVGRAARTTEPVFVASPLTAFSRDKARRYIRDRYPCLGCHQLDGEGGRIGPDLSRVGERLAADAIYRMIVDPQQGAPGSVMPRMPMPENRAELLANFLATQRSDTDPPRYLSLVENPPRRRNESLLDGQGLYLRYCAMCHGDEGGGDGYNAAFLPVRPTRHADGAYMASRPDDTLFDGIHVGGFILDRSHRMPGFGELLSSQQIRSLVAYLRQLCNCEGPSWTRNEPG